MALSNGDHIFDLDIDLEKHDVSDFFGQQNIGCEDIELDDITCSEVTNLPIDKNDKLACGTDIQTDGAGVKTVKAECSPANKESAKVENNNSEVLNETLPSSESAHFLSENESDVEELDLSANIEQNGNADHDAVSVVLNSEVGEKMVVTEDVTDRTLDKEDETACDENLFSSNLTHDNETETSPMFPNHEKREKNDQTNSGNSESMDIANSTTESIVECRSSQTLDNDHDTSGNMASDTDSSESVEQDTKTDVQDLQCEQQGEVGGPALVKRRKRKRKSSAKKWTRVSPYKAKNMTVSPLKLVVKKADMFDGAAAEERHETDAVDDGAVNETLDSQADYGDAETDPDDSSPSKKLRRTTRVPSTRQEFFIDDEKLLNEMWKQTDPSVIYRKKRNSLLFSGGKRNRHSDVKPLTEEELERYSLPFKHGWKREIVIRGQQNDEKLRKNPPSDVYYFPPVGSKLRSMVQVAEYLTTHPTFLTTDNFTFMRKPIGVPEGEVTRNALASRGRGISEGIKRKRIRLERDSKIENLELAPKPEIVIERDSDEFLAPIIAAGIQASDGKMEVPTQSNSLTSPKKEGNDVSDATAEVVHPSKEKCILPPRVRYPQKGTKVTARKSSTPHKKKKPIQIPYVGMENLCSMNCPGLKGIAPLLHCNVCMCLFHNRCVNYFGDKDSFTCLRCNSMTATVDQPQEQSENSPMQVDPKLVNTLINNAVTPLLSASSMSVLSSAAPTTNAFQNPSFISTTESKFSTSILLQKLQQSAAGATPENTALSTMALSSERNSDMKIKEEPQDESYDAALNGDKNPVVSKVLQNFLSLKSNSTEHHKSLDKQDAVSATKEKGTIPNTGLVFLNRPISQKKSKYMKPNTLLSPPMLSQLPNSQYQLIPVGPPLPLMNVRTSGMPAKPLLTNVLQTASMGSLPLMRVGAPTTISLPNLEQITKSVQNETANIPSTVPGSLTSPTSTMDNGINLSGPVVVNAKSCAPLNGQLLTLPPAVVKRLTLSKPLALKINNRQINVPPSGFFQTASGLKVFLPPNTFPTAEDNTIAEDDNKGKEGKTENKDKASDEKGENEPELNCSQTESKREETCLEAMTSPEKSRNIRTSKRYQKLCFIKMLFGAYDCMECIFRYLNIRDLVSVGMVCKRWRLLAQNSSLWRHVNFRDMAVSDWKKAMQFLNKRQVKSISLVGLKHNSDSNRTWHQLISSLQDLQFLQKISFDEVPASVLHSLCSRLTQLEVFCADQITEIGSDSSKVVAAKLDIGKFAGMSQLKELRLCGKHGLAPPSFSFSGGMAELGSLSNLEILSVTSLQDMPEDSFHFISQLMCIRDLSLGNCSNWTQNTFERLGQLIGLEKLRLETISEESQSHMGEPLSRLEKLHTLELFNFSIPEDLGSHLKRLTNLKKLTLCPSNSYNIAKDNTNAMDAAAELTWLEHFDLILPDKNSMLINLDDNDNREEETGTEQEGKFVPFLVIASISEEEQIVAHHTEYASLKELTDKLQKKLPKTQVKVFCSAEVGRDLEVK